MVAFKAKRVSALGVVASQNLNVLPLITDDLEHSVADDGKLSWRIKTADLRQRAGQVPGVRLAGADQVRPGGAVLHLAADHRRTRSPGRSSRPSCSPALALVILLAVLANLVTRLVVNPVRVAARTAQRLSAGLLDQRMAVQGEDDLAAAGRVVQPDGGQPAAPDRPAGGDVAPAAPVHLRRLARAAHAADHGPDGRRSDLHRAGRASTRRSPAAPSCSRPSWTGSRACSPTCWRSAGSTPGSRCSTPSRPISSRWCAGWWSG